MGLISVWKPLQYIHGNQKTKESQLVTYERGKQIFCHRPLMDRKQRTHTDPTIGDVRTMH